MMHSNDSVRTSPPHVCVHRQQSATLAYSLGVEGSGLGSALGAPLGNDVDVGSEVGSDVGSGVGSGRGSALGAPLGSGLGSGLGSDVGSGLVTGVGAPLGSDVGKGDGSDVGSDIGSGLGSALSTELGSGVGSVEGSGFDSGVGKKGGPLDEPLATPESTTACEPGVSESMPECEGAADTLVADGSVVGGEVTVMAAEKGHEKTKGRGCEAHAEVGFEVAERSEAVLSPATRTSAALGTSSPEKHTATAVALAEQAPQLSLTEQLRLILRVPDSKTTAMLPTLSTRPGAPNLQVLV